MSEDNRSTTLRVLMLSAALAVIGGIVFIVALALEPPQVTVTVPVWAIALAFFVAEAVRVKMPRHGSSQAVSLSEIPMLVGVATLAPGSLIGVRLGSAVLAHVVRTPRPQPLKFVFNMSNFFLEASVVLAVYRLLLDGGSPASVTGLTVGLVALLAGLVVGEVAVASVVAITRQGVGASESLRSILMTVGISAVAALIAVATLAAIVHEPLALVGVAVVTGALYLMLHVHASLSRRFEDLEAVYDFTRTIDQATGIDELVDITLHRCRSLFGAGLVEVVMERGVGSTATRLEAGEDEPRRRPATPAVLDLLGVDSPELVAGPWRMVDAPEPVREHYAALGVDKGMLATLTGGRGNSIMIVVGFDGSSREAAPTALRLFDTLTRQARVAFERVHLMDRLITEMGQKEHQAFHDSLTGLPNRLQFTISVDDALRRSAGSDSIVAVLLIDLDHFKEINDTLGHQRGDVVLRDTAMRLSAAASDGEHLARLGGDEFGVVLRRAASVAEVEGVARHFAEVVSQPFQAEGLTVRVTASIGIAFAPEHGSDGATLLRRAEVAMYGAKESTAAVEVYDPSRDRFSTRRLALAADLRTAVDAGALGVHYQPKVGMGDGHMVGVEALSRWHHPHHGDVSPDEFIELAERTGLIGPLTEQMVRTSFHDAVRLRDEGHDLSMAVNIAPSLLVSSEFPELLAELVGETGIDPRTVVLEVTESTMMTDSARARMVLESLDEIGVELSIDDFGTGYSSLAYLSTLPVDEVKIDRSFVMGMAVDDRLASIVTSTTALGHALGLRVVAEGVENRGTWDLLRKAGCDLAQGFHVAKPMPFTDLLAWIGSGAIADGERAPRAVSE